MLTRQKVCRGESAELTTRESLAAAMLTGQVWLRVPESMCFVYRGRLPKWVVGKDLILHTIGDIGVSGARYRAMEFRDEALIYDRLAVSVTGETLTEVYLEQRRALEMEERGGARARVDAVEVLEAREIEPRDRSFGVRSIWTVGGTVTHFGHRHFRQNRYDARVEIVPTEGAWKIGSIEVLDEERIR